jgi:hypothetical protein
VYRPGLGMYGVAVLIVATGLYGASLPGTSWILPTAYLAGLVVAGVWVVGFILAAQDSRLAISRGHWLRWTGIPTLGIMLFGIVLSGAPSQTRFDLSRQALDRAASDARAGLAPGRGWIGLMPVDSVAAYPDGVVTVTVSGTGECGFANLPGAWRADMFAAAGEGNPTTEVAPGWWGWCRYAYPLGD